MKRVIITGMLLSFACAMQAMEENEEGSTKKQPKKISLCVDLLVGDLDPDNILLKLEEGDRWYLKVIEAPEPFVSKWESVSKENFMEVSVETLTECAVEAKVRYLTDKDRELIIEVQTRRNEERTLIELCSEQKSKQKPKLSKRRATAELQQAGQVTLPLAAFVIEE